MTGFNLSAWAITHRPLVHYFMAMLVIIGVASYMKLGRNEDPTFTIKAMTVRTQWPGATLNDTLLQITERIERKLQETPNLDYIKSYTNPGQSTIFVYLKGSSGPKAVADAWYQVRKKIKDIELTLPQGVIGPVSDDEFGDTYGIVYGFTADGFTHRELRDYVEEIRSRLLQVPDVNKVNLIGQQAERIFIEFSPTKLAGYGLKPAQLAAVLQAQNAVAPTGVITTDEESITLRVSGAMASEKDIREMNFDVGGRNVRLADIAEVRREYADPPDPMFRINGTPGLGLSISMRDGGDVLALGENIHHTMEELKGDLPIGIEPVMVANQPDTVHHSIDDFMEALWESIAIVLVVSILSLGLRAGAIVIICIPLVLAIVFGAMYALGIDLQRISLGALIISLGLLVDDAMITIESMVSRLERGDDKSQAAIFAYSSTAMPRLAGTLVTVAAFVPVGFARSDAGEYTFSLFAVVALALIASWVVSGICAPVAGIALLRPPKHTHSEETLSAPMRVFKRCLLAAMRAKWITILVTLGLFVAALWGTRFIPEQFFPSSDRPELLVDLKLQDNASVLATREVAAQVDKMLAADPDVVRFSTYVRQGAIRFYLPLDVALPNDFFAQSVVVTKGLKERDQVRARLEQALAGQIPAAVARIYPLELGPSRRLAGQISRQWPRPRARARYRAPGGRAAGEGGGDTPHQLRLGRASASHARAHRSGPGAPARFELAGRVAGSQWRRIRQHDHTGTQQHIPDQCRHARRSQRANLSRIDPLAADPLKRRNGRAVAPDRQLRIHPGISDRLAPGSGPNADSAGRCGAGSVAGDGGQGRAAEH
jgi:multidrug efflux pump subunit AcrB